MTHSSAKLRNDVSFGAVVAHGLVQADEALLDQILGLAASEEVRARLQPDESGVAPDQFVLRPQVAVSRKKGKASILNLTLSFV